MYLEWTSHLQDEEEKTKFQQQVRAAKPVLERLRDILDKQEMTLDRTEVNIDTYTIPNWDYRQAHKNGNRESIAYLKRLVDLDQQKIIRP